MDKVRKASNLLDEGYVSSAKSLLTESAIDLNHRLKLIRIADTSEGGWSTVDEYEQKAAANESDDDKRIRSAELRALRKKKDRFTKNLRFSPLAGQGTIAAPLDWRPLQHSPPIASSSFPRSNHSPSSGNYNLQKSRPVSLFDQCFTCGGQGHWTSQCRNRFNPTSPTPTPKTGWRRA